MDAHHENAIPSAPEAAGSEVTVINPAVAELISAHILRMRAENDGKGATALNPAVRSLIRDTLYARTSDSIGAGTVLFDKFVVSGRLNVTSGEADLFLCGADGKEYVAKIYRRRDAVKKEVIDKLSQIASPYVAVPLILGEYRGFPCEILPYYKNGSLAGRRMSEEELRTVVIPCVNEALRILHDHGIVHKDLKPSNIMLHDDGKGVSLIDFGVSSVLDDATVLLTQTGMTPEYAAPETFRGVFLPYSDYYSFGITLCALLYGHTPFYGIDREKIVQMMTLHSVPLPDDMPKDLRDLVLGLTYQDLTHRAEKDNPNKRWSYTEVQNWCSGIKQTIPGEGKAGTFVMAQRPYGFLGGEYGDLPSLVRALSDHWQEGKEELFSGRLYGYFIYYDKRIALLCDKAEKEARERSGRDDVVFFKLLYGMSPEMKDFVWKGRRRGSISGFGREMLESLRNNEDDQFDVWEDLFEQELMSGYVAMIGEGDSPLFDAVSALESDYRLHRNDRRGRILDFYAAAFILSGQRILKIGGLQFASLTELTDHIKKLADGPFKDLAAFCHKIIGNDGRLDIQFEAWLRSLGYRQRVDEWRAGLF